MSISILILAFDEEANLPRCLESIAWCDDVVVLDSYSTDRTIEIAKKSGARLFQRKFDNFAGQRNHALKNIDFAHDWVLHLDADEVCTEELRIEIEEAIQDDRFDAYRIASKTIFFGKWLRFSGMYPTYQVRLGRQPVFKFKQVGHGQREDIDPSRVATLEKPYLHHSFSKGLSAWVEKANRYTTDEADEAHRHPRRENAALIRKLAANDAVERRRAAKSLSFYLPFRPILRFIYMYLFRMGFLDGLSGLRYCCMLTFYEFLIDMKIRELHRREKGLPV